MTTPDTSRVQETVDMALWISQVLGWAVLPLHAPVRQPDGAARCTCAARDCGSTGKHPAGALVPTGVKGATTDEATIVSWWQRWPWCNLGIATGAASGIVVLDVDADKGGEDSLFDLVRRHGEIPETPIAITGRGHHFYFAHPGRPVQNKVEIAPGLDVRGDDGYVVAPPSLHASGKRYWWSLAGDPESTPLASLPGWFAGMAARRPVAPAQDPDGKIVSHRNVTLARVAGALRRVGVGPDDVLAMIATLNERRCEPPLGMDEVEKIARSIGSYAPAAAPTLYRTVDIGHSA